MLLKDCSVGSMVRLNLFCGKEPCFKRHTNWRGTFEVLNAGGDNYLIDGEGNDRSGVCDDPDYQFEIVSNMQLTLNGVTYNLTPSVERKTITIDGVEYEMEEAR